MIDLNSESKARNPQVFTGRRFGRRVFLAGVGGGAAVTLLTACGASETPVSSAAAAPSQTPAVRTDGATSQITAAPATPTEAAISSPLYVPARTETASAPTPASSQVVSSERRPTPITDPKFLGQETLALDYLKLLKSGETQLLDYWDEKAIAADAAAFNTTGPFHSGQDLYAVEVGIRPCKKADIVGPLRAYKSKRGEYAFVFEFVDASTRTEFACIPDVATQAKTSRIIILTGEGTRLDGKKGFTIFGVTVGENDVNIIKDAIVKDSSVK